MGVCQLEFFMKTQKLFSCLSFDGCDEIVFEVNKVHLINLLEKYNRMIETPIRRKQTNYPKDFIPANNKTTHPKRFTFHQDYQIEVNSIKKYEKNIEEHPQEPVEANHLTQKISINPEISLLVNNELQQESPLGHHSASKKPNLDQQLLKKPRFTMLQKAQVAEGEQNQMENSMSPGCIRKQLENRQPPLPKEDPCRIDLLISNSQINKLSSSLIKYKSSGQFLASKWRSTEKDIVSRFKEGRTRIQSVTQLPKVSKVQTPEPEMIQTAKEQYERFRKRQQSLGNSFSKVNNLLTSMHKKEGTFVGQLPNFQPSVIEKLKDEINRMAKNKVGKHRNDQQESSDESEESTVKDLKKQQRNFRSSRLRIPDESVIKKPQLLVSYRSSLSYLKDLYCKASHLNSYHLVVKIPKIFTEKLIFREQEREELYESAKAIFEELKIECQNLVIKRYTNCTMIVSRNICLIWHFDGKRYLGGWQSQYLDEGFKHGLGLEWEPKKYVYYGEFVKNKKQGLGIYKDRNDNSYVGYWKKGTKVSLEQMCYSDNQQEHSQQAGQSEQQEETAYWEGKAFQYV